MGGGGERNMTLYFITAPKWEITLVFVLLL